MRGLGKNLLKTFDRRVIRWDFVPGVGPLQFPEVVLDTTSYFFPLVVHAWRRFLNLNEKQYISVH